MSNYNCWVNDFPDRCLDLLELFIDQARAKDREVTLLLSVASAAICIPSDRLRDQGDSEFIHLDSKQSSGSDIKDLLKSKIKDIQNLNVATAPYGKLSQPQIGSRPDCGWDDYRAGNNHEKCFGCGKQFGTLIKHLRNALAHGNIYTLAEPSKNQIIEIVFLSSIPHEVKNVECEDGEKVITKTWLPTGDYNYLTLNPEELIAILKYWVSELGKFKFEPEAISDALSRLDDETMGEAT